jgi:predicted GIY-YIG superfamily endonuclease
MILGTASGIPVVACVATPDRWNHMLDCPHCGDIHSHGGFGPTSPAGAVNGGRWSHCGRGGRNGDFKEMESKLYVLMEVPGTASFGRSRDHYWITRHVTYELDRMPDLDELLAATIDMYETSWAGPGRWRRVQEGHAYPLFRTDGIDWPYAYYGRGKVTPGTPPFADAPTSADAFRLYRFFDGAGRLLYIGITMDPTSRWRNHERKKDWWAEVRSMTAEPFPTLEAVRAAETAAIKAERPIHNIVHNGGGRKPSVRAAGNRPTDLQHYTDNCPYCFSSSPQPAVEIDWKDDGLDTLHVCDEGHQWTCSWGDLPFVYEDCECAWCLARTKRRAA